MALVLRFILTLLFINFLCLSFKYAVDTCIPDMGSRLFAEFFKLPEGICHDLESTDIKVRQQTRIDRYGVHWGKHSTAKEGLAGVAWLLLSRPMIFFTRFPNNPLYLAVYFILTFTASLVIALCWHTAWVYIDLSIRKSAGADIVQKHPEIASTDYSRATYRLITDTDDTDLDGEATQEAKPEKT